MNDSSSRNNSLWLRLTGSPAEFSMENRAFNYVSIVTFPLLIYCIVFDLCIAQYRMSAVITGLLVVQGILYYRSRYRRKFQAGVVVYGFFGYIGLVLNYYLNSGIKGPTVCLFLLMFQFIITIGRTRLHFLWLSLHILIVAALLWSEYLRPDWVPDYYLSRGAHFFDVASCYGVSVLFSFSLISYLRNYYNHERLLAEERAIAIELKNSQISEQNEVLAKVNEEKNKLFSIISHDLRTPLDSISGYLQLLTEQPVTDKEKAEIEAELLKQTKYTSDLLLNLLYWSRAQMQGIQAHPTEFDMAHFVEDILVPKRMKADRKGITLDVSLPAAVVVVADKDMMRIVLRNVINNAIKFTQQGGTISVSVYAENGTGIVAVADSGIGIPDNKKNDIFSLKTRSSLGTDNEKGIGLGLIMSKEFLAYQHGDIRFESAEGKGTTFYISLPLATA